MATDASPGGGMNEIRHTYHGQLDDLRVDVVRLGLMATDAIAAGTDALLEADLAGADRVIHADAAIDDLTHSLEERCYTTLARQQPMASDLRMVVAVLRTIHEIERTGDLMVNVAKTTRRLYPVELPDAIRRIIEQMGRQAGIQLRVAIEAFAESDCVRAHGPRGHGRRDGRPPARALPDDLRPRPGRRGRAPADGPDRPRRAGSTSGWPTTPSTSASG